MYFKSILRFIIVFVMVILSTSCFNTSKSNDESNITKPNDTPNDEKPPSDDHSSFYKTKECVPSGEGVDYPVGDDQKYKKLSDVPWDNLKPADTVRIFYKPTPYKEKIVIRTSGTKDKPIRICGVAGADGQKPILDGDMAKNDPDDKIAYTTYEPMEALAIIMIYNKDYELKASNIIIDSLHIKNAKKGFKFIKTDGSIGSYEEGAACIRVQAGDNIVIRNNEIENCSNGIFTMSQGYNEAHLTRNILIEGNYFHKNGEEGSYLSHALYIQAIGAIYQYNYFGPNDPKAQGVSLKERVAGSIIRYNWFESGSSRFLDLVEVEDAASWYIESEYRKWLQYEGKEIDQEILKKVQDAEKAYRKSYVYGNFFNHVGSKTDAGSMIHYGWDNDPALAREGKLYFYNNTISIREDRDDSWRFRLFDMRLYSETPPIEHSKETIEAFNNIIYISSETQGKEPAYFCMSNNSGTINLGINWISSVDWQSEDSLANCYYNEEERPTVNGISNLIDTTNSEIPIDLDTLKSKDIATIKGKSQALSSEVYPIKMQYVKDLKAKNRENSNDLGAMELP